MIRGAVSEAAGGDFLDGAISAAMVHLFNDFTDSQKIQRYKELSQARNEWERFQVTVKWDMIAGNQDMIKVGKGAMSIYNGLGYALPNMWNNAPPAAKGVLITAGGIFALPVIIPTAEYGISYVYMNPATYCGSTWGELASDIVLPGAASTMGGAVWNLGNEIYDWSQK